MSRLVTILRAAHCSSTHHYFAIDALERVQTAQGQRLANVLLKYHDEYLIGAKAPDKTFRDFRNHVIHVADNNWGGAPAACEEWLEKVVSLLNAGQWKKAAYACGVLSHYFTDPLMPLHTAQSERESIVHRAMEWSVCKSYEELYRLASIELRQVNFQLSAGENWMRDAVLVGARMSHRYYNALIDAYDFQRGSVDPPAGLNSDSREMLADIFGVAITGWAAILTRIADLVDVKIPEMSLGLTTLLASIDMPLAWIVGKISSGSERRAVRAIFDEFQKTGKVKKRLPAEISSVRSARLADVEKLGLPARSAISKGVSRVIRPKVSDAIENENDTQQPLAFVSSNSAAKDPGTSVNSGTELPDSASQAKPSISQDRSAQAPISSERRLDTIKLPSDPAVPSEAKSQSETVLDTSVPDKVTDRQQVKRTPRTSPSVSLGDNIVDAPSIGPKTAKRFNKIGVHTIEQFLKQQPRDLSQRLATRWITEDLIQEWQQQAKLVCEVPALCGYKSQLLVEVGCCDARKLAESSVAELHAAIVRVCNTSTGERILRSSRVPDLDDIDEWVSSARDHRVALGSASLRNNAA